MCLELCTDNQAFRQMSDVEDIVVVARENKIRWAKQLLTFPATSRRRMSPSGFTGKKTTTRPVSKEVSSVH